MLILSDMDSVVADWDTGYDNLLDSLGSRARNIPRHNDRQVFNLHHGLGPRQSGIVRRVMDTPGFYAELPLVEGAAEALNAMLDEGHDVLLCSSPWTTNPTCASDKYDWAERMLGMGWADRVILTKDKTLVRGDILIDDKPNISGRLAPTWTQILFDAPYNREVTTLPRLSQWADWKEALWDASLALEADSQLARTPLRTTS